MFANTRAWSLGLLAMAMLSACSPELNWREVHGEHANYALMFPAKPASANKSILLAGQQRQMYMQGAQAADLQFVIAHLACNPDQQTQILAAMRQGMLLNLGSSENAVQQVEPGIWQIPSQQLQAWAKFFAADGYCYQMLILGKATAMNSEMRERFFPSFKTLPAKPPMR